MMLATLIQPRASSSAIRAYSKTPEAQTAMLFRHADAEVAHLAHLLSQVQGNVALDRVEFVGHRQHLAQREIPRHVLDHAAFVVQIVLGHCSVLYCWVLITDLPVAVYN